MKTEKQEQKRHTPAQNHQKRRSGMNRLTKISLALLLCGCVLALFCCSTQLGSNAYQVEEYPQQRRIMVSKYTEGGSSNTAYPALIVEDTETQDVPSAEKPQVDPAQTGRLVVYNAVMNVVVERISDSLDSIKATVINMGGYMQEMSSKSITLKVPAEKFQDIVAEVEKLGEVTRKDIKGSDVTEEMRDLTIRLKNAEEVRDRLTNLLDKAEKIEDILKIEKELERITETIELLKGKISFLQNKIAFSTITIYFNSPLPQDDIPINTPFYWVHNLGSEMSQPVDTRTYESSYFSRSMFTVPNGYIKYYEDKIRNRAMSAEGVIIHVHKEKNYKGGTIEFWSSLVRRVLVEQKVVHIDKQTELKLNKKNEAVLFKGSKQIGTKQFGYLVAIAATKRNVYLFEAWGPKQEFDKDVGKLETAAKSMQLK